MRPPQFNRGDRVWTSLAPLNCGRYDIGTVERDNGFSVTVKWDKAGRLVHEDWPNHPIKPIRRVVKETARKEPSMANERYPKIIAVLGGASILGLIVLWCLLILQRTGVPHA